MRDKALIAFSCGLGTLDELFEILTLVQTHKTERVPVLLFGSEYWEKVINFDAMLEVGTIAEEVVACFQFADTQQAAWDLITSFCQL